MLRITPEIALSDGDVNERAVPLAESRSRKRARKAGGIELRLDIVSASLPEDVKTRLLALHDRRVTSDGVLVIVSREHTSQQQNREAARARLVGIIRDAVSPSPERRPSVPPPAIRPARRTGRSHGAFSRVVKGDLS